MASAFYRADRKIWIADFRGYRTDPGGKRRTMTVPAIRIQSEKTAKADAEAFAEECERYCRLIEDKHEPADILHARRLGVITVAQADALSRGIPIPPAEEAKERIKIRDSAIAHPSSQRDKLSDSVRYLKYVDEFIESSGVVYLADLKRDHLVAWVNELRRKGWAWDSRRHAMLYLRRACAMGPQKGLPDVLAKMPVDKKDARQRPTIKAWTLEQLVQRIEAVEDPNAVIVLVLGGLCGMRPTEIIAADIEHLGADGVLETGAKTAASVRSLPLPAYALARIREALGGRKTGPMLQPQGPQSGERYTLSGLHQTMRPHLKGPPKVGPKALRKTFATWASRVVEPGDLERFLGHASALFLPVTTRHYLATYAAEQLKPAAKLLDAAIRAAAPKSKRRRSAG